MNILFVVPIPALFDIDLLPRLITPKISLFEASRCGLVFLPDYLLIFIGNIPDIVNRVVRRQSWLENRRVGKHDLAVFLSERT